MHTTQKLCKAETTKTWFERKVLFKEMLNLFPGSEKRTSLLHVRDLRNRFTILESLFTIIHGQRLRSFLLKFLKIVRFKINLLLNNTLRTFWHLKVIFTVPNKEESESSTKFSFFSHYSYRVCEWISLTLKLITSFGKVKRSLFYPLSIMQHFQFSFWTPPGLSRSE